MLIFPYGEGQARCRQMFPDLLLMQVRKGWLGPVELVLQCQGQFQRVWNELLRLGTLSEQSSLKCCWTLPAAFELLGGHTQGNWLWCAGHEFPCIC